jgi:LPXTG-motif cell wall-anchored protein
VYLAVDYEAQQLQLAEVNQNDVTPSPVRFLSADAGCGKIRLSAGAIAAIVLGVVFGLALLGGIGYFLFRRRRRARNQQRLQSQPEMQNDPYPGPEANTPLTQHATNDSHRNQQDELERRDSELPGVRRTFELESPNGGHPPPSPTEQRPLQTRQQVPSPVDGPPTHATQPWYERKYA